VHNSVQAKLYTSLDRIVLSLMYNQGAVCARRRESSSKGRLTRLCAKTWTLGDSRQQLFTPGSHCINIIWPNLIDCSTHCELLNTPRLFGTLLVCMYVPVSYTGNGIVCFTESFP